MSEGYDLDHLIYIGEQYETEGKLSRWSLDGGLALQVLRDLQRLRAWKAEALAVESEWDAQAVGALLGVELGASIRVAIQPGIATLQREADEAREQVAARDKIIDQLRASHAEEAREWDEHRTAYINDCVRLARAAGFELDDAPEAIADLIVRKRRDSQREVDRLREALFAASWERMVMFAVYVGKVHEWEDRLTQACLGFHNVRADARSPQAEAEKGSE